jgi:eukaryotic-like serine/threonine-protein kinase
MAATRRHHTPRKHVSDLAGTLRQRQQAGELTIMPGPIDPSRDLLFGLLALQNGLIDQVQLVAAFQSWTRDKGRPLAVHLVGRGDLDAEQRAGVEAMVALHLKKHGGDAENSLAAIPVGRTTREKLAGLGDPQIDASLARVGSGSGSTETDDDPDRTPSYAVGTATSDGQRFRVLRPHARGGLGAVFVALDAELHREVALKQILDDHADDPTSRQRFLLEAEVTGGLEHPGIVPVYGLGTYGDGRPYYAMRFIRGDSLKEAIENFHADPALQTDPGRRSLELHKLLRRFVDVCNAIDYAHCRGVLHRDIKPGNVLVGKHGETLIMDWGLAKPTGQSDARSGERTLRPSSASGSAETLPGSALGTPAYMSPEQAEGDLDRLGPRSDVYSLGATLYYLLTARPPFEGDDIGAILRGVQRGDIRPPRTIDPAIDRALEAVCLKAMALKPEDRYGSCRALAEDIERWMADEPVSAWREPLSARARRWARHHRTGVTSAAAALLAGLIGLTAVAAVQSRANAALEVKNRQLIEANHEAETALAETTKAKRATEDALAQKGAALAQSEESRQQAKAINDFLTKDLLAQAEPTNTAAEDHVSLLEVLDRAAAKVGDRFAGQPEVEDALRRTIAWTYHGLASWEKAERQWRAVLAAARRRGGESREALDAQGELAHILVHRGRLDGEVLEMAKSASEGLAGVLGPDHPDTLASRGNLAEAYRAAGRIAEAIELHEATLKTRESKLGPDHPHTLTSRINLAQSYRAAGRTAEAIELHQATLKLCESKLGPDHPDTLQCRNDLATAYRIAGRTAEAIALHEATLKLFESKVGPDHPRTLTSRHNLAAAYWSAGRTAEAITLHEASLKTRESKLGPDHPDTLASRNGLAAAYVAAGRIAEAVTLHEATLRLRESKLGPDHPNTLISRGNLAKAYLAAGQLDRAVALLEQALQGFRAKVGPDHPYTLTTEQILADAYESLDRWAEAEALRRDALARRRKITRPDRPLPADDLAPLGRNLLRQSRWSEAEPLLREVLAIRARAAPEDWARYDAMSLLGAALLGQGRYSEAEPLIVPGYEGMKERQAKIAVLDRSRLREAAERVVRLYEDWGKAERAAMWKAKLGLPDLPADVFARP